MRQVSQGKKTQTVKMHMDRNLKNGYVLLPSTVSEWWLYKSFLDVLSMWCSSPFDIFTRLRGLTISCLPWTLVRALLLKGDDVNILKFFFLADLVDVLSNGLKILLWCCKRRRLDILLEFTSLFSGTFELGDWIMLKPPPIRANEFVTRGSTVVTNFGRSSIVTGRKVVGKGRSVLMSAGSRFVLVGSGRRLGKHRQSRGL